jgi:hypothetical protein
MKTKTTLLLASTAALLAVGGWLMWPEKPTPQASSNPQSPISNPQSLPLRPIVSRIIHEGPDLPYLKFNYLIKELPLNLAPHDIDALIAFITGPRPKKFQDAEWGSLVNDIQENLTVQTTPSQAVARALIAIFRDETKIQMQRDYALQHIGGFAIYLVHTGSIGARDSSRPSSPSTIRNHQSTIINPSPSSPQSQIPHLQSLLLSELTSAASQSTKPWSGTALNLLDGLLRAAEYRNADIPGLSHEALVALAIPIARDPAAPLNARLPALQVAARRDSPAARDLARAILSSPEPGIMLTQSAAAALARLGTTDDLLLLQTASNSATRHTATALNEAIRSIESRLQVN